MPLLRIFFRVSTERVLVMETRAISKKTTFFTHEKGFRHRLFVLLATITLQNFIAYSVNMADNIMLGSYSQDALSGAATVNQIFFIVQSLALAIGDAAIMIASQYWGKKEISPIRKIVGSALKVTLGTAVIVFCICAFCPHLILQVFTTDEAILNAGLEYMNIIKYTFVLFLFSNCLMAALRAVEVVKIAFICSIVSLILNCSINWLLIFGNFGLPRLGITGAAIGTVVARIVEFLIILFYVWKKDRVLQLFSENPFKKEKELSRDYRKAVTVMFFTEICWSIATPIQSAILGSMSKNAIAANSIATTFYNYLKVVIRAASSASSVIIGSAVGAGDMEEVKAKARTLSVIDITLGVILGICLFLLRKPLLSLYVLNDEALFLADQMIILYSFIMVAMSYQMPVIGGIIRAGGDVRFHMLTNLTGIWCLCIPLSFLAAYVWHAPVIVVVFFAQIDQIAKCPPAFCRFRTYKWIRKLTR